MVVAPPYDISVLSGSYPYSANCKCSPYHNTTTSGTTSTLHQNGTLAGKRQIVRYKRGWCHALLGTLTAEKKFHAWCVSLKCSSLKSIRSLESFMGRGSLASLDTISRKFRLDRLCIVSWKVILGTLVLLGKTSMMLVWCLLLFSCYRCKRIWSMSSDRPTNVALLSRLPLTPWTC